VCVERGEGERERERRLRGLSRALLCVVKKYRKVSAGGSSRLERSEALPWSALHAGSRLQACVVGDINVWSNEAVELFALTRNVAAFLSALLPVSLPRNSFQHSISSHVRR